MFGGSTVAACSSNPSRVSSLAVWAPAGLRAGFRPSAPPPSQLRLPTVRHCSIRHCRHQNRSCGRRRLRNLDCVALLPARSAPHRQLRLHLATDGRYIQVCLLLPSSVFSSISSPTHSYSSPPPLPVAHPCAVGPPLPSLHRLSSRSWMVTERTRRRRSWWSTTPPHGVLEGLPGFLVHSKSAAIHPKCQMGQLVHYKTSVLGKNMTKSTVRLLKSSANLHQRRHPMMLWMG